MSFKKRLKEKFSFDVDDLPAYTDEQSEEFIQDIISNSEWLQKLQVLEGVKGKQTIKLLTGDVSLQEMDGCTPNPDGTITFNGRDIETKRLYAGIELCNEDLNGKWTQMLNALGANRQDTEMVLEPILIAYIGKLLMKKIQRIMLLGDTTSLDPDLNHFDGYVKIIENDADVVQVPEVTTGSTPAENAFLTAKAVIDGIDEDVFDSELEHEIIMSRSNAQLILDHIYNTKDYNALTVEVDRSGGGLSFIMPTTSTRIRSINTLKNVTGMYSVVYNYLFMGTDLESDMDGIQVKYDDYNNKLKAEVSFRLGAQFVLPQYFVRTVAAS